MRRIPRYQREIISNSLLSKNFVAPKIDKDSFGKHHGSLVNNNTVGLKEHKASQKLKFSDRNIIIKRLKSSHQSGEISQS